MRSDLNKQLCERERHLHEDHFGNYRHNKNFAHSRDDEFADLPTREAMKRRYQSSWNEKTFNENLTPLKGLVRKSVGRRWDDFYSELCKNFKMTTVINRHILQHLESYVERNTFVGNDGKLYYRGWNDTARPIKDEFGPEYYVHPISDIITKNKFARTQKQRTRENHAKYEKERLKERRVINEFLELRRRNGVWFFCEIDVVPPWEEVITFDALGNKKVDRRICYRYDLWMQKTIEGSSVRYPQRRYFGIQTGGNPDLMQWNDGKKKYVKSVRTASHKDLKRYGVI